MTTILENISATLLTRLEGITTENGFAFDVAKVEIVDRDIDDWDPVVRGIIVEQKEQVKNDELSRPGNPPAVAHDVGFEIYGFASQLDQQSSQLGVVDAGVTDNQMSEAIRKAITTVSSGQWHTFGDNAINASIGDSEQFDSADHNGSMVTLNVTFRVSELDPAVKR